MYTTAFFNLSLRFIAAQNPTPLARTFATHFRIVNTIVSAGFLQVLYFIPKADSDAPFVVP